MLNQKKYCYLTIDDGPNEDFEERCKWLEDLGVLAIWYCLGTELEKYPNEVIRAIKKGHIIGNHSYNHVRFSEIGRDEGYWQIRRTDELNKYLYQLGYRQPEFNGITPKNYSDYGFNHCVHVDCSLDTMDWAINQVNVHNEVMDESYIIHRFNRTIEMASTVEDGYEILLTHSFAPFETTQKLIEIILRNGYSFMVPLMQEKMHCTPLERKDEHGLEKHLWIMNHSLRQNDEVVLLGDSITRRWEDNLDEYKTYLGEWQCANFGIGGDTIKTLIWRLKAGELQGMSPKVMTLLIGTNGLDIYTDDDIVGGIALIIKLIKTSCESVHILLHGIFPREEGSEKAYTFDRIMALNNRLKSLSDTTEACDFLELWSCFINNKGLLKSELFSDGLHLNKAGYCQWGEVLNDAIKKQLLT
jgi:peptidoglycan/xylan/chitin deacetylase (PgdA/CDA1 family)/lysophospholipase L1-like esterase